MSFDTALLFDLSLRMSAVLALAWVVTLAMRRAAAATRHLVWSCAVAVVILLPAMQAIVPDWRVVPSDALPRAIAMRSSGTPGATAARQPVLGQSAGRESRDATATGSADAAATITWPELALTIWLGGAAVVLAYMLVGVAASWRIRRAATPSSIEIEARELAAAFAIRQPVAVVESFLTTTPLACGVWRPRIVLPRDAVQWSEERRHVVVLHELAHIKRRDCLTQAIAQLVCAAYWFNPLAWIAARRLRVERERACDDFVLAAGMSGGVAYVLDPKGNFARCLNPGMVDLDPLDAEDWQVVRQMIAKHIQFTGSAYAKKIQATLADQPFLKVMPRDYKRVRLAEAKARAENREPEFAELVG